MSKEASFCHVFLSFKGETRNNFTCFLYEALKAQGFVAFMDKSDLQVGDDVGLTIKEGIRNSMSTIIIFSQNYAYSTWCLDELVLILERKKNSRYFIMPIFYEVDVRDIRYQLGNYALALKKHELKHHHKVEKWREALFEASNIYGDHVEGLQSTFIQKTVKLFHKNLISKFPECCLPTPKSTILQGSSSSFSRHVPSNDKVIVYTTSVNNGLGANGLVKTILMSGNVVFEERNCSKEPKYLTELQELVGNDKVRFPMVIVNGKDLCGEEEVEGLEDFQGIVKLKSTLNILYAGQRQLESINNYMKTTSAILGQHHAWGGSSYASEFVGPEKVVKPQSLGGLQLLHTSDNEADWSGGLYASQFIGPMKVARPRGFGGLELLNSSEADWGGGLYAPEFICPKKVAKPPELGWLELLHSSEADWGGGLYVSEFLDTKKFTKPYDLGELELLQPGETQKAVADGDGVSLENVMVRKIEMKVPEMYILEEINAEFRGSLLARVGLMGIVYLKTHPSKYSDNTDTEFSLRVDGTSGVKRFVMQNSHISILGNGMFRVRTTLSNDPIPIFKYSILPRAAILPLRIRLIIRHTGTLLSMLIQYVSNPDLPAPLQDVTFIMKLPVCPRLLKVSPKAILNITDKELKWYVPEIPVKGNPGRLRAKMLIDSSAENELEDKVVGYVTFSSKGIKSLSGISLQPASEDNTDFYEVEHRYKSGVYLCN